MCACVCLCHIYLNGIHWQCHSTVNEEPSVISWLQVLIHDTSGSKTVLDTRLHYGTIQPGESYSTDVQYYISPRFATGRYNLSIHTDVKEQVFEFQSNDNNVLSTGVHITLHLADLTVSSVEASLNSSSEGNTVRINYTVVNTGSGSSVNSPWIDRVGVSDSPSFDDDFHVVTNYIWRNELLPNEGYSVELLVNLNSSTFGELYIHVITDYYNRVEEEGDSTNQRVTGPISVPLIHPDLAVVSIQVSEEILMSGNEVQLSWTVANVGNGTLKNRKWTDSVYLAMSTDLSPQAIKLEDSAFSYTLEPTESYNYSITVSIPNGLFGAYYLFAITDNFRQVDEADSTVNNVDSVPLLLELPTSPDLIVKSASVSYIEGDDIDRILTIQWTVVNVGYGMMNEATWIDQLYVSSDPNFDRQNAIKVSDMEVFGQLEANEEYSIVTDVLLPMDAFGGLFVYAEVDSANDIVEISAEDNNILRSENQVSVPKPVVPQITVQINNVTLPSSAFAGEVLSFQYDLLNVGEGKLPFSSWTDGVYLVKEKDASRTAILEEGFLLETILHNRALESGEQYKVFRNISIPFLLNQLWYFAVVSDINGNLGDNADIVGDGDILSQAGELLLIEQGPLPDLVALPPVRNLTTRGGQPMNVSFQVANIGNNTARGVWYGAIYLSRDAVLDPFDMKLKTVLGPTSLDAVTTHNQTAEIFVPYDLPSSTYYLFYEVDVGNRIPEHNELDNNIAKEVFTILRSISTDIAVVNVNITPTSLNYEDGEFQHLYSKSLFFFMKLSTTYCGVSLNN